jgi:hypothetical protein
VICCPPTQTDYGELFEALPKGSFTVDDQWRIQAFNKAAEQITGFSRGEALGRHCWDIFRSESCHNSAPCARRSSATARDGPPGLFNGSKRPSPDPVGQCISVLKKRAGEIIGAVETFHPAGGRSPIPWVRPAAWRELSATARPCALFSPPARSGRQQRQCSDLRRKRHRQGTDRAHPAPVVTASARRLLSPSTALPWPRP